MNGGLSILGQKCGENKGAFIQKMDQKWDFYLRMIQRINRDFVKSRTYKGTVYLLYSKAPKIATLNLTSLMLRIPASNLSYPFFRGSHGMAQLWIYPFGYLTKLWKPWPIEIDDKHDDLRTY